MFEEIIELLKTAGKKFDDFVDQLPEDAYTSEYVQPILDRAVNQFISENGNNIGRLKNLEKYKNHFEAFIKEEA